MAGLLLSNSPFASRVRADVAADAAGKHGTTRDTMATIEKALQKSDIGVTPSN